MKWGLLPMKCLFRRLTKGIFSQIDIILYGKIKKIEYR